MEGIFFFKVHMSLLCTFSTPCEGEYCQLENIAHRGMGGNWKRLTADDEIIESQKTFEVLRRLLITSQVTRPPARPSGGLVTTREMAVTTLALALQRYCSVRNIFPRIYSILLKMLLLKHLSRTIT